MKNPNGAVSRLKQFFRDGFYAEDYPGGEPRFQFKIFARKMALFLTLPLLTFVVMKAYASTKTAKKGASSAQQSGNRYRQDGGHSQIITFSGTGKGGVGGGAGVVYSASKRAPGSLVKVRLLNVVETYSTAPVHAQIVDGSLGDRLKGGTLIGDANPDVTFERIAIQFRYARDPNRDGVALPITARALSLDGTLGLDAGKKEGFVARSAIGSAAMGSQDLQKQGTPNDLQGILLKALTAGLFQELGTGSQVERNRAQVLTLKPQTEFFAELTDFFPAGSR